MTATAALPQAEVHAVPTSDGTEVRLTRYRMGDKGPLVLAPGYGNAARAFTVETVNKNWVQYLGEHGYDVWLLDYRASPGLPPLLARPRPNPGPPFELQPVPPRRHRRARLARRDRDGQARERRRVGAG